MATNGLNPPVFTYSNFIFIDAPSGAISENDNKFKFRLNNSIAAADATTIQCKIWDPEDIEPQDSTTGAVIEITGVETDEYGISSFSCPGAPTGNQLFRIKVAAIPTGAAPTGDYVWSDSALFKKDTGLTITGPIITNSEADEKPLTLTYDIEANGSTDAIVQYRVTVTPTGSTQVIYDSGVIINNKYDKIIHRIYDNFYSFNDIEHIIKFDYTTNYGIVGSITETMPSGAIPSGTLSAVAQNENGLIKITSFPVAGKLFRASSKDNFSNYMYLATVAENGQYLDRIVDDVYSYRYVLAATGAFYATTIDINGKGIAADFESDFILDKDNQLILKFNNELSNYRQTFVSASQTTIGSQYPYVRRMAANNYKTFNVGGLITYQNENFDTLQSLTGVSVPFSPGADNKYDVQPSFHYSDGSFSDWQSVVFSSNELPEQEIQKERLFRDKVIEFLSRDTVKLFKSSTEGLILVSLKDISLTPEKVLGRMIYNFTASATEVAPVNQESLQKFGFIK